jgi:anti-sigma regulatory factor (Ser/Thr protein kinase)
MPPDQPILTNGLAPFAAECTRPLAEHAHLEAICQRRALTTDTLTEAVANRADVHAAPLVESAQTRSAGDRFEVRLPLDQQAPGAARTIVAQALRHASVAVLEHAKLIISELVTNSVRHSGGSQADGITVRVHTTRRMLRLEVDDPGRDTVIAPRAPDFHGGGGLGLQLVHTLSEDWGVERATDSGTRVWARLAHEPRTPPS